MSKTYILQKDLPDVKAGTKLLWHERRGHYEYQFGENGKGFYSKETVENNPEWFLPEFPKEVDGIPADATNLEVFHIKDGQAFIGFKIANGNFHFIGVPYNPKKEENKSNDSFQWTREFIEEMIWEEWGHKDVRAVLDHWEKGNPQFFAYYNLTGAPILAGLL